MSAFRMGISFDTGAGTQTITQNLPTYLDLSSCTSILLQAVCTKADTDAGDLLDIFLDSRDKGGFWRERVHMGVLSASATFIGSSSPTTTDPEIRDAYLQQYGTLTDSEESDEVSGSAGASSLAVGVVRNGGFPGQYQSAGVGGPSWRVRFVVTESGTSNADFEGTLYIWPNSELA